MFMFMLGEWQKFQEKVYYDAEWSDQDADTPLLRSEAEVGIYSESHSSESDQDDLETDNSQDNDQEDSVSGNSFKDV